MSKKTKLHWMPLMINDLRNSNNWRSMSKSQRGCFIDLLCAAWTESDDRYPCSVTANREVLYRLTECFSDQDRADTEAVISMMFIENENGRLHNARQSEIWVAQSKKNEKCREAAAARWSKASAKRDATNVHGACERITHASANAGALRSDSDSISRSVLSTSTGTSTRSEYVHGTSTKPEVPSRSKPEKGSPDICPLGETQDETTDPSKSPPEFDPNRQCITSGRHALRNYPFIYIHPWELEEARSQWMAKGFSQEDWRAGLLRANADLESKQGERGFTGGKAFKYLVTHTLREASELVGNQRNKNSGRKLTEMEKREKVFADFLGEDADDPFTIDVTPNKEIL